MAADAAEYGVKPSVKKEKVDDRLIENGIDSEEPNFSDPENYVDNVADDELLGDFIRTRPKETDGIESVIVIDNIPQVGPERFDKLKNIIRKIFSKFGDVVTDHFPMEDDKTKGYMFLEYRTPMEAEEAVKATNGYKLDKQHTFAVNLFSDFEKYSNIPEEWSPPAPMPCKDHGNLYHWMTEQQHDQFCVQYEDGDKTALFLNTHNEPTLLEERARWTETLVKWSPKGMYLTTFHQKGVALWGGEDLHQIMRFGHPRVQLTDFSPCERYLVTFSPVPDNKDDSQALIIWDVRTGQKKRGFHCDNVHDWPIFKWSHDGCYFARMTPDTLSIYETPSFGLLEKKSLKIKDLKEFSWSPTDNIISYWTSEERDTPARVTLIEVPSRKILCVKNLFTVAECKMYWQKSGQYLCVKVDRYKSRKEEGTTVKYAGIYHNFNIFRIREKEIPVDTVEVKDSISAFAWEPVGHKFAVIHGDTPRIACSFYNINVGGSVELIKTLEKRIINRLLWNPNGQFIILAGLRSMSGTLEFIDTADMTVMTQAEHFMATDIEWDPTGRYLATLVSWWEHKVDNAFWMWTFQGRLLHKHPLEKLCQFLWRPRPPTPLSTEQIHDIKKNMKKYNAIFTAEDKMRESKASKQQIKRRQDQMEEFSKWKKECDVRYRQEKPSRLKLRSDIDTDEHDSHVENFAEEIIEFLVDVEETVLEDDD